MGVFIGVIFHFIDGFVYRSFCMSCKKVKELHWRNFPLRVSLFSRLPASASFAGTIHKISSTVLQRHNLHKFIPLCFKQKWMRLECCRRITMN